MSLPVTFQIVEGGVAILSIAGRYGQHPLYRRGNELFAEVRGGYVKLMGQGRTSVPKTLWHDVGIDGGFVATDKLGRPLFAASPAEAERLAA